MEFLLIAAAHFLALLCPGPDFFLITQASLRLPLRFGVTVCAGIAIANGLYLVVSVVGLEIVREASTLFVLMKWLGGLYLLFIGIMLLRSPKQGLDTQNSSSFLQCQSIKRQFLIGFMSAILNPKNAIFYLSLFTVMVSDQTGFFTRCLYALWMMSMVFVWDCGIVIMIGRDKVKERLGHALFYIEKVSGTALAFFGCSLPFLN